MKPKIGCAALVYDDDFNIIGIDCVKGRGIILPGGKWEEGETYRAGAIRELREETGLVGGSSEFLLGALGPGGCFTYTFRIHVRDFSTIANSKEGKVVRATWDDLMRSEYAPYYDVLREIVKA